MESEQAPQTHRFCLPPGTRVEDWRVEGCHGHGAFGVVYRAVRVGQESAGPVALKVALYPWDPRFMREVALLSLIHDPSVPRLCGHGFWKHPAGTVHPFIVMEWVEGTPLYDWAREHNPTLRQVSQRIAQLARALQATHAASAVHRDVKGGNVLVRRSDGRAVLTDFGSGHYQAAARVTWQPLPPGTPAYLSPEAGLFLIRSVRSPGAHYVAKPADDVFALGVTAYRLVTGEYPPSPEPQMDEAGTWHMEDAGVRPPRELNPRVEPQLSALILRMLSLAPEARGTAGELADALEAVAERAGPEADQPLFDRGPVQASAQPPVVAEAAPPRAEERREVRKIPERERPRARIPGWVSGCALALAGLVLVLWTWREVSTQPEGAPAREHVASKVDGADAGTTDVGDLVRAAPLTSAHIPSGQEPIAQDMPPEPFPGQLRPDAKGRCPGQEQVPINGGCWVEQRTKETEACAQNGYVLFKERCYAPALAPRRKPQPTSNPMDAR